MADFPKAFVTGFPVKHSRSPQIHRYWLKFYGLAGSYDPVEIAPDDFTRFIASLTENGFCGGNVTLPHKEQAFQCADRRDGVADRIGAVNTLWFEKDVLCGSNTDAYGFARNLDDFAPGWEGETALVIGGGGASRAVIYALKERGFQRIIIANRTRARADLLAEHFGANVEVVDWHLMNTYVADSDLIVNTTSLGLENHTGIEDAVMPINLTSAKADVVINDIVYTPLNTPFLKEARKAGLKTVDGIGMLLHQAVPGFERWFGVRPDVTKELRALVLADMGEAEI